MPVPSRTVAGTGAIRYERFRPTRVADVKVMACSWKSCAAEAAVAPQSASAASWNGAGEAAEERLSRESMAGSST